MRYQILLAVLICFLCAQVYSYLAKNDSHQWPLIAVVIMVKNEEEVIQATLLPYLEAGIDAFLVFDTGSTDKTIEKAQELFRKYHITHGYIEQEPFVDFSTSRNRALDIADQKFPEAHFFIMPDAEWYLKNTRDLVAFCAQEALSMRYSAYFVHICNDIIDFYVPRLLARKFKPRFVEVVHEAIVVTQEQAENARLPEYVYFDLQQSRFGQEKSEKRWLRDRDLLLKEYKRNPNNPHTNYYLAQTYESLRDYANAYKFYTIRAAQITPGIEDDFMAAYKRALMADFIMQQDASIKWADVMDMYLESYQQRPWRAEPLIRIADHYWFDKKTALSFLFAKKAMDLPYPNQERMFVEKELYDYKRYELVSASAWYVHEFDVGLVATELAFKVHPEHTFLQNNLKAYQNKKKEMKS